MSHHRFRKAGLALGAGLALSTAATAQQAADTSSQQSAAPPVETLGPVVVTAQRREEKLQDVPIAVTAFGTQQLESRGIDNVYDLDNLAPGLQVGRSPSDSTVSQISIRGNSQINPAIYWDPAVGIYLDGVYIGKAQGSIFDVVDLERVEVLRGPQGTLYGRNTLAGAINLVSAKPTGQFDGMASVEVGDYNLLTQKVSIDLPKWGIASFSLGARNASRDGWVTGEQGSSINELNDIHDNGLRFAANFAFMPTLQADYRYDRSDTDQNGQYGQLRSANAAYFAAVGLPTYPSYASGDRQTTEDLNAPSFEHAKISGHSLTVTWDVTPSNTFKSISAYRHLDWSDAADYDGSPLPVAETQRYTTYHELSQELQWLGHAGPLNYVGGLYYFADDGRTNNPQSYFGGGANYDSEYGTKSHADAIYGQLDYTPIEKLTLTAGIRWTQEKKELDRIFGYNFAPGTPYTYLIPDGTHAAQTFYATTPVLAAAYKLTREVNVYARYAEGFKSGGFNGEFSDLSQSSAANIAETETPFQPEKQRSLELGLKTELPNKRAMFNLAVFQNKNVDLQESIFTASGAASSVIRNAGAGTVHGIELETAVVPVKGTRLQLNYAWLDPRFDDFESNGQNVATNRAYIHAPRNTVNAVIDSRLAQFSWGQLKALADYTWTSSYYLYPYQKTGPGEPGYDPTQQVASNTEVGDYALLNLRLSLSQVPLSHGAVGELAVWCRNVTDRKIATNLLDFGPGFGSLTDAYYIDPRTFGITGTVRF